MDLEVREELIEGRVERHDRNHFEVKLDYAIDPVKPWTRYRVEAWLFVPRTLGLDAATYGKDEFYADVSGYIRFKTPQVALKALIRDDNDDSPLIRVERLIRRLQADARDGDAIAAAGRELRLLGCLVRAEGQSRALRLIERLGLLRGNGNGDGDGDGDGDDPAAPVEDVVKSVGRFTADLDAYIARYRAQAVELEAADVPRWLIELYDHVDEHQSLLAEMVLTLVLEAVDAAASGRGSMEESRAALVALIRRERQWRKAKGLPSVLKGPEGNEAFLYRRGLLKRLIMSVLYLETHTEREGRRLGQVGAAVAAGAAMAFAVAVAVWSQARWGLNTVPFFAAAVFSYMLKDRIKEWLRQTFNRSMSRFLWDHAVRVRDPEHGAVIGNLREAVSFLTPDRVPADVRRLRHDEAESPLDRTRKPEVVIKYEKAVRLKGRRIAELHGRLKDISDIIRFDISRFLVRASDPRAEVRVYDHRKDKVRKVDCPKVYHINVVFVLRAGRGKEVIASQRVRVVLDQRGIRRVEEA